MKLANAAQFIVTANVYCELGYFADRPGWKKHPGFIWKVPNERCWNRTELRNLNLFQDFRPEFSILPKPTGKFRVIPRIHLMVAVFLLRHCRIFAGSLSIAQLALFENWVVMFSNTESFSLPAETNEQILTVCRQFVPLAPGATVVPITGGFSGAGIWRLEDQSRSYALRRWPLNGPEPARLRGLHRLLNHVSRLGRSEVPVPILASPNESLVFELGHFWQLEPWMPGIANFHSEPTPERLRDTMRLLGQWHSAARSFLPLDCERQWFDVRTAHPIGLTERLSKLRLWQTTHRDLVRGGLNQGLALFHSHLEQIFEWTNRLTQNLINILLPLSVEEVPLQPCLRDVWHDHVLFSGNRATGLIDHWWSGT
ncbi:MAG: hypothetical protein JWM11_7671 [Planctomycetaceae bacterium]|nr:hypothetical protein [Planctomycetaceae bacterium]